MCCGVGATQERHPPTHTELTLGGCPHTHTHTHGEGTDTVIPTHRHCTFRNPQTNKYKQVRPHKGNHTHISHTSHTHHTHIHTHHTHIHTHHTHISHTSHTHTRTHTQAHSCHI